MPEDDMAQTLPFESFPVNKKLNNPVPPDGMRAGMFGSSADRSIVQNHADGPAPRKLLESAPTLHIELASSIVGIRQSEYPSAPR